MSYGGSKLLKGYRNLNGASAEFFVRCRHGDATPIPISTA